MLLEICGICAEQGMCALAIDAAVPQVCCALLFCLVGKALHQVMCALRGSGIIEVFFSFLSMIRFFVICIFSH